MMKIVGLQKLTLIDYPQSLACTVFLAGCNFRCPWCYSKELVLPELIKEQPEIQESTFFDFLKKRQGKLEGVVLCGGEPTLNKDLPQFARKIKNLGYKVKLDTNGSNPTMLNQLIKQGLLDYVAMDVKLPKEQYPDLFFDKSLSVDDIEASINILKQGNVDYEFRTTYVPTVHTRQVVINIAQWLRPAKRYVLQAFRPQKTIDPKFEKVPEPDKKELDQAMQAVRSWFQTCTIR